MTTVVAISKCARMGNMDDCYVTRLLQDGELDALSSKNVIEHLPHASLT